MSNSREYQKAYYQRRKEEIRNNQAEYYAAHRDEISEYKKVYNKANADAIKEAQRQYREEHKEEIRERKAEYRRKNPDKALAQSKRAREKHEANPEIRQKAQKEYKKKIKADPEKSAHAAELKKEWTIKNADKVKESKRKYREKKKAEKEAAIKHKKQANRAVEATNNPEEAAVTQDNPLIIKLKLPKPADNLPAAEPQAELPFEFNIDDDLPDFLRVPEVPFDTVPEIYGAPVSFGFYAGTMTMQSDSNVRMEAEKKKQKP